MAFSSILRVTSVRPRRHNIEPVHPDEDEDEDSDREAKTYVTMSNNRFTNPDDIAKWIEPLPFPQKFSVEKDLSTCGTTSTIPQALFTL